MSEKKSSIQIYKRLLGYLRPHKKQFFFALGCMVLYGATDGAIPFLIKEILDKIFAANDERMLYVLPVALILFATFRGAFGFLQQYLSAKVGYAIIQDIRNELAQKLLTLSPGFFNEQKTGSLVSRMTNDTLFVRQALTDASAALIRDTVRIIALMIAAVSLDPVLGSIALIAVPIAVFPIIKFGKKVRKLSRTGQDQFGGLTALLQETIIGHKVVQAFNLEKYIGGKFGEENAKQTRTFVKSERYGALSGPTNEVLSSFAIAGIILYGGFSVMSGVRTQGEFIAFLIALFLMYDPVKRLGRVNNAIQTGVSAAERIFEVLDVEPEVSDPENPLELDAKGKGIEFKDVSFIYPTATDNAQALRGISLNIESGKTLALVGQSGGGKSTLVSLLPRFYDPSKGELLIGGEDLKKFSLGSLRSQISLVDQHTFLFNDTVFNNIWFGNQQATREQVIGAAKSANAHDFIESLPEGYETQIGEQGLRLSGGQRARIAIARALLKDAPILILDEATAALDSESERLVQEAIDVLMKGRTVIAIAHRLATIRQADLIAVIEKGQILELGSHNELVGKGGRYSQLHALQFAEQGSNEALAIGQR